MPTISFITTMVQLDYKHSPSGIGVIELTCQHDLGGLALAQGRDAVIVAVNNQGGGIFDFLPLAALPEFEQGWRTPQQISFAHAAATFGLGYAKADNDDGFRSALRQAIHAGGPHVIELVVN